MVPLAFPQELVSRVLPRYGLGIRLGSPGIGPVPGHCLAVSPPSPPRAPGQRQGPQVLFQQGWFK